MKNINDKIHSKDNGIDGTIEIEFPRDITNKFYYDGEFQGESKGDKVAHNNNILRSEEIASDGSIVRCWTMKEL